MSLSDIKTLIKHYFVFRLLYELLTTFWNDVYNARLCSWVLQGLKRRGRDSSFSCYGYPTPAKPPSRQPCNKSSHIPRALDKFKPPFTLPSQVTFPPALWILFSSCSSSGLWSVDISRAMPFRQSTQRESPTLATVSWFSHKTATIAVVPLS